MKKICIFCGSKSGSKELQEMAKSLGHFLADKNIGLVYGGASVGLMGILADAVLEKGGKVWGVMPKSLIDFEVAHKNLSHFYEVPNMHERKKMMYDLSDGFMAIPGGMGTLDELFEITTWSQLKLHQRPIWILNCLGFYDHLLKHLEKTHIEGFVSQKDLSLIKEVRGIEEWYKSWQD